MSAAKTQTRDPYIAKPEEWARLCAYLLKQPEVGLDTEGEGFKDVGASTVTVWSVAGFNGKQHPRGYQKATGYVLPVEALSTFKPLFESASTTKWLHNAPADTRAIHDTAGIVLAAARCTLQYARVAMPGLQAYGLKPLGCSVLGKPYRPGYKEVMGYTEVTKSERVKKTKNCACGAEKCRKRILPAHAKTIVDIVEATEKVVQKEYTPKDMHPGHPNWARWVDYSLEDAVDALELASYLTNLRRQVPGDPYSLEAQTMARSGTWRE